MLPALEMFNVDNPSLASAYSVAGCSDRKSDSPWSFPEYALQISALKPWTAGVDMCDYNAYVTFVRPIATSWKYHSQQTDTVMISDGF
jgi:hypothetical protein